MAEGFSYSLDISKMQFLLKKDKQNLLVIKPWIQMRSGLDPDPYPDRDPDSRDMLDLDP